MPRVLLLILLVWVLYLIIKSVAAKAKQAQSSTSTEEKFVKCSHCGCHVPENESLLKNNLIICNNPICKDAEPNP